LVPYINKAFLKNPKKAAHDNILKPETIKGWLLLSHPDQLPKIISPQGSPKAAGTIL
jgi:hypothetical protein